MKTVIHKAETRGHFNHGWLDTFHSFSFARYFDPDRMGFGTLRVLNDDFIKASQGFGMHPHDNMEIITLVLDGALEHKDSMGHISVINKNDVQVMSAGTGIYHAEYNHSKNKNTKILQIWIFPRNEGLSTRYDQQTVDPADLKNHLHVLVNPDYEEGLFIQQDAWLLKGNLDKDTKVYYHIRRKENGLYAFVIGGGVEIAGQMLNRRDGLGIWETDNINIRAVSECELILLDLPMEQ